MVVGWRRSFSQTTVFERVKLARLLAHGEMVHRASRKPFSIAIFSNARWRGEFREGVNPDGARLFQHSRHDCASNPVLTGLSVQKFPFLELTPNNAHRTFTIGASGRVIHHDERDPSRAG
jgi:hypothetical protein